VTKYTQPNNQRLQCHAPRANDANGGLDDGPEDDRVVGHERFGGGFAGEVDEAYDCCDACSVSNCPKEHKRQTRGY
jgi:hypothetical protein